MFVPSHSMDTAFLIYDSTSDEIILCSTGETGVVPVHAILMDSDEMLAAAEKAIKEYPEEFKEIRKKLGINKSDDTVGATIRCIFGEAVPASGTTSIVDDFIDGIVDIHANTVVYTIETTIESSKKSPWERKLRLALMRFCIPVKSRRGYISFRSMECEGWHRDYEMFDLIIEEYPELLDQLIVPCDTKILTKLDTNIVMKRSDIEKVTAAHASKISDRDLLRKLEKMRKKSLPYLKYSGFRYDDEYLMEMLLNITNGNLPLYRIKQENDIRKILRKHRKERK